MDFKNLPLVVIVVRYEVWVILGHVYGLPAGFSYNWFSAGWYVRRTVILSSTFLSRFWNKTVLFTNFTLSISKSTWSSLYPRFTNHCLNCSRQFLSFSSIEQILLNLKTCPHAVDILYTLPWHDCAWRCWCVSFG